MRYSDYELEDFLLDDFFIQWVKRPDANNKHFWERWLQENPDRRNTVMEAVQIIRSVHYSNKIPFTDKMYIDIFENILRNEAIHHKNTASTKRDMVLIFRKFAALLVVSFCLWVVYVAYFTRTPQVEETNEIPVIIKSVPAGKKSILTLADGSKVYLNSNSSIQYPKDFGKTEREVFLIGEAFFEIQKDLDKPFVVSSGNTKISVLGTTFNVNNTDNGNVSVALVTGKIRVWDDNGNNVDVEPNEMLVLEKGGKYYKTGFEKNEIIGWKDKILFFKKDSLQKIKAKIEKWYGVNVHIQGNPSSNWTYTGIYTDEILENVLEGIFQTSGIKYKIDGREVMIYNPK
ncbi:FecR family protein [Negadavirga shengliensis]|uniref:FecR family protein n=1 Tax=Negadavirga shengliensis TaxID=1389218 RepID=A0ABV9TAL0_9BACT